MTKIREGYKETEIGVIPEDWEVAKLGEVSNIVSGGTPKTSVEEYWDNGNVFWATPTDITKNRGKYISSTDRLITETGLKNSSANLLPIGSVLMTSRATIGEKCINTVPMSTNKGFKSFICMPILSNEFLYYYIDIIKDDLLLNSSGSTFLEISKTKTENIKIAIPPLPEQQRIAEILSTTDSHIENLDKIIEDYQLLKKGMMKKLLTEGIGHTEFKETEIGRIPKEWEVVKLSQVADAEKINSFIDGDWIEKEHITDAGIRLIQTGNIGVGYYIEKEEKKFIFERSFNDLNCKEVYPNDILICRMAEPTGRSCIIPNLNSRMITSVDCVILRVNESYYDNHFVNHYINSEESLKYSYQNQQGTTRKRITRKKLGELKIPVPKLEEQLKISSILNEIDQRIELLRTEVKDFKNFKKSMMEQLLTGKIRTIYLQSGGVI